ncbi:MAG: tRNA pseudouridine(55) synthase TruB [Armatimonadota bacterium]
MDGVLNLKKPPGPTSHDLVDEVRRVFGVKRVGHAGTLDPMASGVLVVCLGRATRIVEYLMGLAKEYRARMILGVSTDTQDSTGAVVAECDASGVTRELVEKTAAQFVGEIEQVPPMISAVKHNGERLYKLARQGKSVERAPRKVTVYSIDVVGFSEEAGRKCVEIVVRCSSGTYIRTLCADIGRDLGCGAHMSALERTQVGQFRIEDSVTVEDLQEAAENGRLDLLVISMADALSELPCVTIGVEDVTRAANGMAVPCFGGDSTVGPVRIVSQDGRLVGCGEVSRDRFGSTVKPRKVLIASPEAVL